MKWHWLKWKKLLFSFVELFSLLFPNCRLWSRAPWMNAHYLLQVLVFCIVRNVRIFLANRPKWNRLPSALGPQIWRVLLERLLSVLLHPLTCSVFYTDPYENCFEVINIQGSGIHLSQVVCHQSMFWWRWLERRRCKFSWVFLWRNTKDKKIYIQRNVWII